MLCSAKKTFCYVSKKGLTGFDRDFIYLFSICLDVPHLTNEHRTQDYIAS